MTQRNLNIYITILFIALILAALSRLSPVALPNWYILYAGDFFWAMAVYILFAICFRLSVNIAFAVSIVFAYLIEISQLFHPLWLDEIRSIKIMGLILGHGFLWSDIIAYTLGITLATFFDRQISKPSNLNQTL